MIEIDAVRDANAEDYEKTFVWEFEQIADDFFMNWDVRLLRLEDLCNKWREVSERIKLDYMHHFINGCW